MPMLHSPAFLAVLQVCVLSCLFPFRFRVRHRFVSHPVSFLVGIATVLLLHCDMIRIVVPGYRSGYNTARSIKTLNTPRVFPGL